MSDQIRNQIRNQLLTAGVRNLREFGYPKASVENIISDPIYSQFFASMLRDNLGTVPRADAEIRILLSEIKDATQDAKDEQPAPSAEPKCGKCPACSIERTGQCACDGSIDDGCFNCTPSKHKRPDCPSVEPVEKDGQR